MRIPSKRSLPVATASLFAVGLVALSLPAAPATADALSSRFSTTSLQEQTAIPFAAAKLFVEFNDTDDDVGVQLMADGEPWRRFRLYAPDGSLLLDIDPAGSLQKQGLTELFWESSEPLLADLSLEEFKKRFPAGTYAFVGRTIDGKKLTGSAELSHVIPNGPVVRTPGEGKSVDKRRLVIEWSPGRQPAGVDIVGYEVVVVDVDTGREFKVEMPAGRTKVRVPKQFLKKGADYEFEVLAIDRSGNQSITTYEFSTNP